MRLIDLSHTIDSTIPTWDGNCGFKKHITKTYSDGCLVNEFSMIAGIGTHMDAPKHFIENASDIAAIALENLFIPACVIDVSAKADTNYFVQVADVEHYENTITAIPKQSLIIFHTGWGRFWSEPNKYRNASTTGELQFPGISPAAIELLLTKDIVGIAIDTLSPDGSDMTFPVHHLLLGANKYIIENIANTHLLPAFGAHIIALPLKIKDATESPIRIVALIED